MVKMSMIKIAPAIHLPPSSSESAFISGCSFGWSFNSNGTRDAFVFKPLQFSVQFQKFDLFTLPRFYSDIKETTNSPNPGHSNILYCQLQLVLCSTPGRIQKLQQIFIQHLQITFRSATKLSLNNLLSVLNNYELHKNKSPKYLVCNTHTHTHIYIYY